MKIYVLGSNAFVQEMVDTAHQLHEFGYDGWLHPHYEAYIAGTMEDDLRRLDNGEGAKIKIEHDYLRQHYKHILESDGVLIINARKNDIDNYIGGNVLIEMGQAYVNDKKIFLMYDMPSGLAYDDEIIAMQPIALHGDLANINIKDAG